MPGSRSPGFSPPHWPRFGRKDTTGAVAGRAVGPVEIQWCWIQSPLIRKPTIAITKAQISQAGGATAYSSATPALLRQYGTNTATATLATACDADPTNMAAHLTTYQATPRPRQPTMTFDLIGLEDDEALTILRVGLAQRVVIVGAPAGTPPGAVSFVVEGISHVLGVAERRVVWQTAAVVGSVAGIPGPWFRWDTSSWDGTDIRPF